MLNEFSGRRRWSRFLSVNLHRCCCGVSTESHLLGCPGSQQAESPLLSEAWAHIGMASTRVQTRLRHWATEFGRRRAAGSRVAQPLAKRSSTKVSASWEDDPSNKETYLTQGSSSVSQSPHTVAEHRKTVVDAGTVCRLRGAFGAPLAPPELPGEAPRDANEGPAVRPRRGPEQPTGGGIEPHMITQEPTVGGGHWLGILWWLCEYELHLGELGGQNNVGTLMFPRRRRPWKCRGTSRCKAYGTLLTQSCHSSQTVIQSKFHERETVKIFANDRLMECVVEGSTLKAMTVRSERFPWQGRCRGHEVRLEVRSLRLRTEELHEWRSDITAVKSTDHEAMTDNAGWKETDGRIAYELRLGPHHFPDNGEGRWKRGPASLRTNKQADGSTVLWQRFPFGQWRMCPRHRCRNSPYSNIATTCTRRTRRPSVRELVDRHQLKTSDETTADKPCQCQVRIVTEPVVTETQQTLMSLSYERTANPRRVCNSRRLHSGLWKLSKNASQDKLSKTQCKECKSRIADAAFSVRGNRQSTSEEDKNRYHWLGDVRCCSQFILSDHCVCRHSVFVIDLSIGRSFSDK